MTPAEGIRMAFELFDLAIEMYETRLRRENPAITEDEIRARINEWLQRRPDIDHDYERVVAWPRR